MEPTNNPTPAPAASVEAPAASVAPATPAAFEPVPDGMDTSFMLQDEAAPSDLRGLVDETVVEGTPAAPVVATTPVVPAAPAAPAATTPATPAPAVVPPTTPGQPVPQPAPAATPAAATPPASAPADVLADLQANRGAVIAALAQEHFSLSEAELGQLQENPQSVIGNMAAKVYYMATVNAMTQLAQLRRELPMVVAQVSRAMTSNSTSENAFYGKFPDLKEHEAIVTQMAQSIKGQRANWKQDEFLDVVGRTVRAMLGLGAPAAAPQAPVVPAPTQPARGVAMAPFRPAPAGVPVTSQPVLNPWDGMGMDLDE